MPEFKYSFEDLCKVVPLLTRNSSSPLNPTELNPLIKKLLERFHGSYISGIGGHSVIVSVNKDIVAKVALRANDPHLSHEQAVFEMLDRAPCPSIVRTFLRRPDITFMEALRRGSLHDRMICDTSKIPVLLWMKRLSEADACIEHHGLVHADINPQNILFDDNDLPILCDLDHAIQIGDDLDVGYEPYVRCRRRGQAGGQYGVAGPITEQFALGSIFWYITRGTELYQDLPGPEQVERLMNGDLPATDPSNQIDRIISDCWLGKFSTIAELSEHIQSLVAFDEQHQAAKTQCEAFYNQLLDDSATLDGAETCRIAPAG